MDTARDRMTAELADIDAEVAELTKRRAWVVLRLAGHAERRRGANGLQAEVMAYLEEHGTTPPSAIAFDLICSRQNVAIALNLLMSRGLVERFGRGKYRRAP